MREKFNLWFKFWGFSLEVHLFLKDGEEVVPLELLINNNCLGRMACVYVQ